MEASAIFVGRSPEGILAKIMTEKQWENAQNLRPNTNWVKMTCDEAMADTEVRHYAVDIYQQAA